MYADLFYGLFIPFIYCNLSIFLIHSLAFEFPLIHNLTDYLKKIEIQKFEIDNLSARTIFK